MTEEVFRKCASVVLVRPTGEVLLVHKPRKKDAWQLPQGGVEPGETLEEAAVRELQEEAGVIAKAVGRSEVVYQYEFPKSYRRFRPDNVCGQRVHFVFVHCELNDPLVTVDQDEVDAYAWVHPSELATYIKRQEYREIVEQLVQEGVECV